MGNTLRSVWHCVLCSPSRRQSFSSEMYNIRPPILIIIMIIISCQLIGCVEVMFGTDDNLDEGDQCTLENGDLGICKKLPKCPSRLKEVQEGKRNSNSAGRCGFDNFTEIACCPVNVGQKYRPAEIACQLYHNKILLNSKFWSPVVHVTAGIKARASEFPYMVALGYTNEKSGEDANPIRYSCGGSLISNQYVLTAAHCVNNINKKVPVEVRLGNVNLKDVKGIQRIPISDIISHPRYRLSRNYNDVAILKLMFKVHISNTVKPICLVTKSVATANITPRTRLVVIGWGATKFDDIRGSDNLMKSPSLSFVNNEECSKLYSEFGKRLPRGIDSSLICAIDTNTTRRADACLGDSGGPLVMSTESYDRLIGITAFGPFCGTIIPGVYTAVYPFLDWIEEHVWPTTDRNEKDAF